MPLRNDPAETALRLHRTHRGGVVPALEMNDGGGSEQSERLSPGQRGREQG